MEFIERTELISNSWNSLVENDNPAKVELLDMVQSSLLKNIKHVHEFHLDKIENKPGIYCFFIDTFNYNNPGDFCKSWDVNYKGNKKLKGLTRPTQLRFEANQNRGGDSGKTVFYIGKRRELGSRLKQHIDHTESGTYGLKLSRNGAEKFKNQMYYSYWYLPDIKDINETFMDMLLTTIEHQLINEWSPRVGKK
jgi:hypothetical protein